MTIGATFSSGPSPRSAPASSDAPPSPAAQGDAGGSITGPGILGLQDAKTREQAAMVLWSRFYKELCRGASRKLRTMNVPLRLMDDEDVAARAFAKIVRAIEQGHVLPGGRLDLVRLLGLAVRQESFSYARRVRTENRRDACGFEECDPADPRPQPSDLALLRERIELRIDGLGDEKLQRIACWKMLDHSNEEIARRLDCSLSKVERKLRRIREKLDPEARANPGPRGSSAPSAPIDTEEVSLLMSLILG